MASTILDRKTAIKQSVDGDELLALEYLIPDNSVATFQVDIRAMELATGDSLAITRVGSFKRAGTSDAAVITLTPQNPPAVALSQLFTELEGDSKDVAAWDTVVTLSGQKLQIKVQGEANKTIEWNLLLRIDQFSVLG